MRQLSTYILSMIVMGSLAACSDNGEAGGKIPSADPPIELRATYADTSISTKAEVGEAEAFKTTLFCVTRLDAITGVPDYTSLADRFSTPVSDVTTSWADAVFYEEWVERTADVAVGGSISWDASRKHHYPRMGANVYLVGVSPVAGDNSYDAAEGTVSYTLDGHMDLMYAGPLAGNKWDGNRFTGNTVAGVEANRSLNYAHLLTQLVFKAKKHDAGGLEVKVNKIIVKSIPTAVNVPLATGEAVFSGSSEVILEPAGNATVGASNVGPIDLGCLYLPPTPDPGNVKITVETSIGTFTDVSVKMGDEISEDNFKPGFSHVITLDIYDASLGISSVEVAEWTPSYVDGNLDLIH